MIQIILPIVLVIAFILTLWGNLIPAPTEQNTTEVPLKSTLQWKSTTSNNIQKADVSGTFTHKQTGLSLGIALFDNGRELAITDESVNDWEFKGKRYRYLWDPKYDIGAWVAAKPDNDPGYDIGIRLSPARVFYGIASPDLLIGSRSAGLGVSFYIPPGYVSRELDRFGIGVGYLADYDGDYGGYVGYLSLSTRF